MSRLSDKAYGGPKLPQSLLQRVSGNNKQHTHSARSSGGHQIPASRKERRKNERKLKKSSSSGHRRRQEQREFSASESESEPEETSAKSSRHVTRAQPVKDGPKNSSSKQGTKHKTLNELENSIDGQDDGKTLPTSLSVPRQSKEKLQQDDAEIAALEKKLRIKSKKLPQSFYDDGLGDLVGDLDEDDSDNVNVKKRKSKQDQAWLASKRQKHDSTADSDDDHSAEDASQDGLLSDSDDSNNLDLSSDDAGGEMIGSGDSQDQESASGDEDQPEFGIEDSDEQSDDGDAFSGFESEEDESRKPVPVRVKENPYVPPVSSNSQDSTRYVPPALRPESTEDVELKRRIRLKTQGLLNRMAESNLVSIISDIEKLYQTNPRQYMTSTLVDLLLTTICDATSLNDPFIILHAGCITALYKVIGLDFGAQMIEGIVTKMDYFYPSAEDPDAGKECVNIISLLSRLFNFQFVTCDLVFDYIKIFLQTLNETNTELLLRVVRTSGSQLRQDDPASLKDIVQLLQKTVATSAEGSLSVRTRFMIDTIDDLKNNKLKAGAATSVVAAEKAAQMKKTIGSLNTRSNLKATEPLRLTLEDIRMADKRGKWWLVGSSWKGKALQPSNQENPVSQPSIRNQPTESTAQLDNESEAGDDFLLPETQDVTNLAHSNNMNTPLRRQIFTALLTSTDYRDAHTKLLKLNLKRAQQHEIPRVLLHCAGTEKAYNHYYTLIASRLCSNRNARMDFQFCLWDFFKQLGVHDGAGGKEFPDTYDSQDENSTGGFPAQEGKAKPKVSVSMRVNYAKLYGALIADGAQSLRVLKPLDLVALSNARKGSARGTKRLTAKQSAAAEFVELLLITLISRASKSKSSAALLQAGRVNGQGEEDMGSLDGVRGLEGIFAAALELPKLHVGLKMFIERVVRKSDLTSSKKEDRRVKEGCKRIADVLAKEPIDEEESESESV